jgi:hypothetical protein
MQTDGKLAVIKDVKTTNENSSNLPTKTLQSLGATYTKNVHVENNTNN